ncbi:MAG: DUF1003 domain-containing protein [Allosphingosinicella sp.]
MNGRDYFILQLAEDLLSTPPEQLGERERQIIERAVRRHRNPLPRAPLFEEELKWHERLSDTVARIGGSWSFIIGFAAVLLLWASLNSWMLTRPFDPYPYIFLNLLLSMLAAIQAPIIMMSQNRLAVRDRRQARRDFEINLKAELEILALHVKLDQLLESERERRGG